VENHEDEKEEDEQAAAVARVERHHASQPPQGRTATRSRTDAPLYRCRVFSCKINVRMYSPVRRSAPEKRKGKRDDFSRTHAFVICFVLCLNEIKLSQESRKICMPLYIEIEID